MNKAELLSTYTAEQLAEMVVELNTLLGMFKYSENYLKQKDLNDHAIADYETKAMYSYYDNKKLQSEIEKYCKILEDAKKEHDCQIAEYQKKIEELQQDLDRHKPAVKYSEEYIDSLKKDINRNKNTINQIDDILEKLFGVRHDVGKPDEFERILHERAKKNISDLFTTELIKVADMLINAMCKPCASLLSFGKPYSLYDMSELRQIAEHLLVYCNHNGEVEE